MTKFITLDIETTGLNRLWLRNLSDVRTWVSYNHRVTEIGAIDIYSPERKFHTYLNPGIPISKEATDIHGMTNDDLEGSPQFNDVVDEFIDFILGATLVIHNAKFDVEFLDQELNFCDRMPPLKRFLNPRKPVVCTKELSGGLSLDDLCKKYEVDNSVRKLHGALIDARLLAECYVKMKKESKYRSTVIDCLDKFHMKYINFSEGQLIEEIIREVRGL